MNVKDLMPGAKYLHLRSDSLVRFTGLTSRDLFDAGAWVFIDVETPTTKVHIQRYGIETNLIPLNDIAELLYD